MLAKSFNRLAWAAILGLVASALNGCLPLAAGAAAGYMVRDRGYEVQSPLKKTGE